MDLGRRPLAWLVLIVMGLFLVGVIALQSVTPPTPPTQAPQAAAAAATTPATDVAAGVPDARPVGGASTTINATEKDYAIAMDNSSVPAGSVTFKVQNNGATPHNLGVTKQSDASKGAGITGPVIKDSPTIDPGKTTSITVDLQPGTYNVVCTVPGHVQLGMIMTLTVK
ncbi:MAG: cupredoxin domain-containing protein [Thermomicrobia bacterium]|nr:cupredoxin domain-containing protein [Thermomicrobia bacterium]MCA1722752.1 cupredoxin domain-containing protein [Thermomicrobia bacterium]